MEIGSKGLKRIRTDPKMYPGSCFFVLFFLLDPYIGLPPYDCLFFQVELRKIFSII